MSNRARVLFGFVGLALTAYSWPVTEIMAEARSMAMVADDPILAERARQIRADRQGQSAVTSESASSGFSSLNVNLMAWLPLSEFDPFFAFSNDDANDCWGYVSPSGREYAIIGLDRGTAFVEITDPANPDIVGAIPANSCIWRDIKVYQQYAYAVSECHPGIQVINLTQIDSGLVSLTTTVGSGSTHNVALNEDSGFLYRTGGSPRGLGIYDLADPALPVFVTNWTTRYCHDAQVVTWTEAPFAGQEVAFCFANDSGGGGNPGVDILNVTNKGNITLIGSINLSQAPFFSHPASFSHQGWLSSDRQHLYFDDELDEANFGVTTTMRVIDISDLTTPTQVAAFTNGNTSRDHNLYTVNDLVFAANYTSGLRVYDVSNPLAPVEVGFFDTHPSSDSLSFNGLWSNYPAFPSGTVIGSDINAGLFIWRLPLCFGDIGTCSGHGVCMDDACVCDSGWVGVECECSTAACPNDCSGNGTCVCGACDCDLGWIGLDCSVMGCADDGECGDGDVCTQDDCVDNDCTSSPGIYGDVDGNGTVSLLDLFCVLDGLADDFSTCSMNAVDIEPCIANGTINLADLFAVLNAFSDVDPCCGG